MNYKRARISKNGKVHATINTFPLCNINAYQHSIVGIDLHPTDEEVTCKTCLRLLNKQHKNKAHKFRKLLKELHNERMRLEDKFYKASYDCPFREDKSSLRCTQTGMLCASITVCPLMR